MAYREMIRLSSSRSVRATKASLAVRFSDSSSSESVPSSPLYSLPAQVKKLSLLFCAVERGGQVSIPNGHAAGVLLVADAGDGVFGAQVLGSEAAHHVHLIGVGGGHKKIGVSRAGLNVTIIDNDEEALHRAGDQLDVMTVRGNGVATAALREAGAGNADLLVAATNSDEVMMRSTPISGTRV